jgi:hypothetical protein
LNGSPGDYSLTAGYGGTASPTGTVSFVDTSFGNNVLATGGSNHILHDGWHDADYFFGKIHGANYREQHRDN